MDSNGGCFAGGDAGGLFDQVRIPGRGLAEWNGKDGLVTVDDIAAKDQRNAEAAFLERDALSLGALLEAAGVEERAPTPVADSVPDGIGEGGSTEPNCDI